VRQSCLRRQGSRNDVLLPDIDTKQLVINLETWENAGTVNTHANSVDPLVVYLSNKQCCLVGGIDSWLENRGSCWLLPSHMAHPNRAHRRTHNLLLISKLLSQRDSTSPFALVLDSLEQPAKCFLQEYVMRAKAREFNPQ
jgi:hypothetical protein